MATPQKIPCKIGNIISHGHQVYTVELIPTRPAPKYYSGQFLHLALDHYDPSSYWPDSRVFSIVSSPSDRSKLKIAYSVKGKFTTRMENELSPGKKVWVKMPYGNFIVDHSNPVVLIAGGTGITAFTSFLENVNCLNDNRVTVFYGAKERSLLIFKEVLDESRKNQPNLKTYYFIEHAVEYRDDEVPGLLSIDEIWERLETPFEQEFYLSGPPLMMKQFIHGLTEKGIQSASIHIDAWD